MSIPPRNQVHVQDLADAFLFLLHNTLSSHKSPKIKTGWETFHSVEVPSQAENWRTISEGVGDALYEFGKVMSKGAVSVPWETDLGTAKDVLSANARSRADRLAAEGWKPRQPSMMECLRGDVKQVLEARFGVAT